MKKITYWEAYTYGDCEGRSLNCIGRFSSEMEALKKATGKSGYNTTIDPKKFEIVIFDSVEESEQDTIIKSVNAKKLTAEEIEYIKKHM